MPSLTPDQVKALRAQHVAKRSVEVFPGAVRGLVGGAGDVLDAGQFVGNEMQAKVDAMGRRIGLDPSPVPPQSQEFANQFIDSTGMPVPQGFAGKTAERFTRGLPYTAAAGPALYGLGGAKAVASGIIGDVVSSVSGQLAEDAGYGPLGQTLAGFAGMFVPSNVPDTAVGLAQNTSRFAREAAASAPIKLTPAQAKKVGELAVEFGVDSDEIVDSMRIWQGMFGRGPKANPRQHIDEAIKKLREAQKVWPNPEVRPHVAQILHGEGGENLAQLWAGLSRDPATNQVAGGLKIRLAQDLEEKWATMIPNSSGPSLNAAAKASFANLQAIADDAWRRVPKNEMPNIPLAPLDDAANAVRGVVANRGLIDPELKIIADLRKQFGNSAPFDQVDALRKRLGNIAASVDNPLADTLDKNRARVAMDLLRPIDKYISGLPDQGTAAFLNAKGATRNLYQTFNRKSPGIRALLNFEDGPKIVSQIKGSGNAASEAKRVMSAIADQPGAIDSFKSAVWDDLFKGDLTRLNARSIRGQIRGKRRFYQEVFGNQVDPKTGKAPLQVIDELLTMHDTINRTVEGTAAGARVTRSGMNPVKKLLAGTAFIKNPTAAIDKGMQVVSDEIDKVATDKFWRQAIFTELMFDTDRAIQFMEIPTPREIPQWKENFAVLYARARARNQARLLSEGRASARAFSEDRERAINETGGIP